jgi:lipid-A-disaccharide synthase
MKSHLEKALSKPFSPPSVDHSDGADFRAQRRIIVFDLNWTPGLVEKPLRIYVVAGEASGDSHGAELVRALRELDPNVEVRGLGGPRLIEAGVPSRMDFVAESVMGIIPVVKKFPFFRRVLRETLDELVLDPPDVLVPIDYPGFNLRLARSARKSGIFVCYYVAPQRWAWAAWKTKKVRKAVDHLLCLFAFEKPFFERHGIPSTHVGHPIFDALRAERNRPGFRETIGVGPTDPIVALLPGSRAHEIEANLPTMVEAARAVHARASDARFLIPCANPNLRSAIEGIVARWGQGLPVLVVDGQSREIARRARVAIVTSGTATLELLFHEVPMVVVYRANGFLVRMFRRHFMSVRHASLVNILAGDRDLVPEFLGDEWNAEELAASTVDLLRDGRARKRCLAKLETLKREVSARGASRLAAEVVLDAAARRRAAKVQVE